MPSGKKSGKKGLSSGPNGPIPYSETVLTEQPSGVGHSTNVVHEPTSGNAEASMVGGNSDTVGVLQSSNTQENIPEMYDMSSDKESQHEEHLVSPNSQSPVYGSSSVDGSITTVSEHGVDTNSQYSSWSIPPGKNFATAPGSVASEGNTDSFEFLSSQASVGFGGHSSSDGSSVGPDCKDPALMVENVLSDLVHMNGTHTSGGGKEKEATTASGVIPTPVVNFGVNLEGISSDLKNLLKQALS